MYGNRKSPIYSMIVCDILIGCLNDSKIPDVPSGLWITVHILAAMYWHVYPNYNGQNNIKMSVINIGLKALWLITACLSVIIYIELHESALMECSHMQSDAFWCSPMLSDAFLCILMQSYVVRCSLMHNDVFRCSLMWSDAFRCSLM